MAADGESGASTRSANRLAIGLIVEALICLAMGLAGWWFAFGISTFMLLVFFYGVGYARAAMPRPVPAVLITVFVVLSALLGGIAYFDRPQEPLRMIGGLPASTALLIYGIWPFGVVMGVLYGLVFDRVVLPEDKLVAFLKRYRRGEG